MIRKIPFFPLPFIILLNVCRTIWGYSFVPKQEYGICHIGSVHWSINVFSPPLAPDDTWSTRGEQTWRTRRTYTHEAASQLCSAVYGVEVLAAQNAMTWMEYIFKDVKIRLRLLRCNLGSSYLQKFCPMSSCLLSIERAIIYLTIIN